MPTAHDILVERAERDFDDGLAHARARLRETHGRFVSAALDGLIMTAVATLGMRSRMRADVQLLLGLADRVAAGEDAAVLAQQHVDHVLRLKSKMHLIAREDDPDFQHIRRLALDLFVKRLPDLARMSTVQEPADYPDLVRKAFPERAYVDAMIDDNARAVEAIVDHLEKHPHVLRMPGAMTPKLAHMARDMVAWKLAEVRRGVDAIYGPRS